MSDKKTSGASEQSEKLSWQTPTIEEMDYTATEAVYSPGPAQIDGVGFYTH